MNNYSQSGNWSQLTPQRLLSAALFISLFVLAVRPVTDTDLWWHLATGRWIVENGAIPRADPFSFTRQGEHWVAHEWLADVLLYGLYRLGGESALILFTAAIVTLTFAIVYRMSALRPHAAIFTTLLAALASAITWAPRPLMLTTLFAALTLFILHTARASRISRLWLLPPLMLIWANLHSGFVLGLVLIAATLVGESIERLADRWFRVAQPIDALPLKPLSLTFAASVLVSLVNPNGVELLVYPYFTLTSKAMQTYILEWHSPNFHDARFLPFAALLLATLVAFPLSPKPPRTAELLILLGLTYESFVSLRNIPLFAVAVAPILTQQMQAVFAAYGIRVSASGYVRNRTMLVVNWLLLSLIALAGLARVIMVVSDQTPMAKLFPVAAADYLLANKPEGPMLNSYNLGGYLIWRLYPTYRVFIDGRADVYGDAFMDEYQTNAWQPRGVWRPYLDRHNIRLVLMEKESALSALLAKEPGWSAVFADDVAIIYRRQASP